MHRRQFLVGSALAGIAGTLQALGVSPAGVRSTASSNTSIPHWVVYPDDDWEMITPEEAGFNMDAWNSFLGAIYPVGADTFGEDHSGNKFGTVITRAGYLIKSWGDPDYLYQSASVGKAFTKIALQIALDQGKISSQDDLVNQYWIGDGRSVDGKAQGILSHPHKYLNTGFHTSLTFAHLAGMQGGFRISNGWNWGGDPLYDNYAFDPPGSPFHYSSGGFWRMTQALTYIFQQDLKTVLDEALFSKMGIKSENWYWLSGNHVFDDLPVAGSGHSRFYPTMPGYGRFVDPPYSFETNNGTIWCLGGGGWVGMTPKDLARVGLLIATRGIWKGQRLISDTWLLDDHAGGNSSDLIAWPNEYISWARVTTAGISTPNGPGLVSGPPQDPEFTPTPTATYTPTPTATHTPTATMTATETPTSGTGTLITPTANPATETATPTATSTTETGPSPDLPEKIYLPFVSRS